MLRTVICHIASSGPRTRIDIVFLSEEGHVMSRADDSKAAMLDLRLCSDEKQEEKPSRVMFCLCSQVSAQIHSL